MLGERKGGEGNGERSTGKAPGAWLWAPGLTGGVDGIALEASASERYPKKAEG